MIGSLLAAVAVSAAVAMLAACAHAPRTPMVTVGDAEFVVDVLRSSQDKGRGLSGSPSLEPGTGALFVYAPEQAPAFWMKGMLFDLDFVWIGGDCTVVEVTERVPRPAPGTPDTSLPVYSAPASAAYNLEINAGEVETAGISPGDRVGFSGFSVDGGGC